MLTALDTIPGVDRIGAISIVVETGGDMRRFPSAGQVSQLGRDVSRPERECRQTTQREDAEGNRYLRRTLIQAALGATRKKGSALQARDHRVKRHRGHKTAVVAVGHQILEIAYYVMRDGVSYDELGAAMPNERSAVI